MRYATRDLELHGVPIAAGDAVVVWLGSANRDEDVFAAPFRFDIRRAPNRHLAFGSGPHYCIGHGVARLTLRILFDELFRSFAGVELAGTVEHVRSNFVAGIKHLPLRLRARSSGLAAHRPSSVGGAIASAR
jgi:cytochrome P450